MGMLLVRVGQTYARGFVTQIHVLVARVNYILLFLVSGQWGTEGSCISVRTCS